MRQVVKIEMGARSEIEPAESPAIQPLLAGAFKDMIVDASFPVRTVAPRRTFWEKAMLLHEETYRPEGKPRKARLSRHYYDLWCLITKGVAAQAVKDEGLFERVAAHRRGFFRYGCIREEMFFRPPPPFDEVLAVAARFEKEFNQR